MTVEVDTIQAQKLAIATQIGRLSLTLRGVGETDNGDLKPVTADELSDYEKPDEAPEFQVRVRRAGRVGDVQVDETVAPADEAATGN